MKFDAVVMDIAMELLPIVVTVLFIDIVIIIILRRKWTKRQKIDQS